MLKKGDTTDNNNNTGNKKKNILPLVIIAAVALVAVLAASVFMMTRGGDSGRSRSHLARGNKYLDELNYEQAIASFMAAIEIDKRCADAYIGAAEAYVELGDLDAAKDIIFKGYLQGGITDALPDIFEIIDIKLDEDESVRYAADIEITVLGADSEPYDYYVVDIYGKYSTGLFGSNLFGLFEENYKESIVSDASALQKISLKPHGEYIVTVRDGMDKSKAYAKIIKTDVNNDNYQLVFSTDFGIMGKSDYVLIPDDAVEYGGHYYYIYGNGIAYTFDDALDYCAELGGYLATITSPEENDFLYSYIMQQDCYSAYFGLIKNRDSGRWEWCTGEDFSYSNWHEGEPNSENINENYGMFYYEFNDGTWNDGDFGEGSYYDGGAFICEWGDYFYKKTDEPGISTERNVVLTLDVSGSMSGTPLEETKRASKNFVNTVFDNDASIGIVTYDDSSYVLAEFSQDGDALSRSLEELYDGGGTNIEAGLRKAHRMLNSGRAKKKIIVLMSDGEPNEGKEGDELVAYAASIKDSGVIIYTVGFFENMGYGKSSAQVLMERLASDGCHYEVASADDLIFFFNDVADVINGQRYIYIRVACPVDITVSYDGETLTSKEDELNTRTEFGTLTFEENPDTNGYDDDQIKVLRLKEGVDYDISIEGYGRGIMDYTIGFMDHYGEYSDLRRFEDIKVNKKTVIDTVANNSGDTVLRVDEDGDGKYDITYKAGVNEYGEEVVFNYRLLYIAIGCAGAIAIIVLIIVVRIVLKKKKERKVENG